MGGVMKKQTIKTGILSAVAVVGVVLVSIPLATGRWPLRTPDQQGHRLFEQKKYAEAADCFADPMWKGIALFKQGEFKKAAGVFAGYDTAEGAFNHGNALVMQGEYDDAIARYDRALELKPTWDAATTNRNIAILRAKMIETTGGNMTGGKMEADDFTFDKGGKGGKESTETGTEGGNEKEMRAVWLRRVQTKPADFLRSKFAHQQAKGTREK